MQNVTSGNSQLLVLKINNLQSKQFYANLSLPLFVRIVERGLCEEGRVYSYVTEIVLIDIFERFVVLISFTQ